MMKQFLFEELSNSVQNTTNKLIMNSEYNLIHNLVTYESDRTLVESDILRISEFISEILGTLESCFFTLDYNTNKYTEHLIKKKDDTSSSNRVVNPMTTLTILNQASMKIYPPQNILNKSITYNHSYQTNNPYELQQKIEEEDQGNYNYTQQQYDQNNQQQYDQQNQQQQENDQNQQFINQEIFERDHGDDDENDHCNKQIIDEYNQEEYDDQELFNNNIPEQQNQFYYNQQQ